METAEQLAEQAKQIEELNAKLAEASTGTDDELRTQLESLRNQNKELIEGRDKAKAKARAAEEEKLAKQGEFQTLAEQRAQELAEAKAQLEEREAILNTYKERDEKEFQSLLDKVPESFRESIADESLALSKRLELARKFVTEKPTGPGARPAGSEKASTMAEEIAACTTTAELKKVKAKYGHY